MLLDALLTDAQCAPHKAARTALVCGQHRLTYGELDALSNQVARVLLRRGLARGDRVAICLENSIETVIAFFAVWKLGAIVVAIHPSTKGDKLARLIADADARALIVAEPKLRAVRAHLTDELAIVLAPFDVDGVRATRPELGGAAIDLDLALILYTSGSTGTPKGVMHTHQSLVSVTRSIATYLALRDDDVVLSVLPLSFGYGITQLLPTFLVGATLVLERSFAFPQLTLQRIEAERATCFAMVPTIATVLLQNDLGRFNLSSLRTLTNAGAGIAPETLRKLRERLPCARIFPMYGQTECIRASYLPPELVDEKPTSVGRAIPNTELWIVDEDGRRLEKGHIGELVVRSASLMRGYWARPEATSQKLRPGRVPGEQVLYTGDLFRVDDDGWFYFVARKDDIIKTRGEKVSPREVENVLHALPGVAEAAVIGEPDPILGEIVKAFVVLDATASDADKLDARRVLRHCADHLEDFAIPKLVEIVDVLPKNANHKIDKQALRERTEEQREETT